MDELRERALEAYRVGWSGDLRPAHDLDAALRERGGAEASALLWLFSAQRWHAQPEVARLPEPTELLGLAADEAARPIAELAAIEAGRASAVAHDLGGVGAWASAFEARGALSILHAWRALASDAPDEASALADEAGATAAGTALAPVVVEATAVRALAAELAGELDEATELARRASRMARTEGFPQSQYLANVVLARVRRSNGAPHLATRILTAVARVAPPPWRPWLSWELLLAGAVGVVAERELAVGSWSVALQQLIDGAVRGDVAGFDDAAGTLAHATMWPDQARDLRDALAVLDPRHSVPEGSVAAWCRGETTTPPGTIQGLCVDLAGDPDAVSAFVCGVPSGGGLVARRLAGLAVPLAEAWSGAARTPHKPGRNDVTIAALALAGSAGLGREELFRSVYGFAYKHSVHRGLFKALVHRVREQLGDAATLHHDEAGDVYALELHRPILVPDARCAHSLEDQMLRFLARHGNGSAKGAAGALSIPLRTAQTALKNLVEDGAIAVERKGRNIEYRLEDTTFKEPTVW